MFFMVISLSLCKAQAKVRAIYTRLSQLSIRTAMLRPCRKRHAPEPGRITEAFSFFNEVVIGGAMNTGFAIRGQPVILRKKRLGQIYTRLSRCSLYREQQFPGFPGSMTPAAARRGILLSFPPFGVLLGAGDV
mgnify:CR=1 FL=1